MDKLLDVSFGALVVFVALLPGAVGDLFFRKVSGINWREPLFRTVLRWVGLSIAGLTLYVLVAQDLGLAPPIYVLPSSYASGALNASALPRLLVPLCGHVVASAVSAIILAGLLRGLARIWPEQPYGAWDVFVANHVPFHWVVIGLEDGSVYHGKLKYAEKAVSATDRDLILEEPARFDGTTGGYHPTGHQHLFLPARAIYSVATVYDPRSDKRVAPTSGTLYQDESYHDRPSSKESAETATTTPST